MADPKPSGVEPSAQAPVAASATAPDTKPIAKPNKPSRPPNPVWKMMGLPNLPKKLPSRNWMIFWTLTGSLAGAIIYDKRETKRAQRKWCKLVEHLKDGALEPRSMPRKLTVFIECPPADGLRIAQDHFKEYVKPVLVASGIDWDFIQGRKEGDVRAELAEKIRKQRSPFDPDNEEEDTILRVRATTGIKEFDGPQGDIVIGRNTWKEYVRGLHEGWLGPLTAPVVPDATPNQSPRPEEAVGTLPGITLLSEPRDATSEEATGSEANPAGDDKPKKPKQPPPFITTAAYTTAQTPTGFPSEFSPSIPVQMPHILGFLNTPVRFYRFLNRRELADDIGRSVATIILNTYDRAYESNGSQVDGSSTSFVSDSPTASDSEGLLSTDAIPQTSEQALALIHEEKSWHKSIRRPVLEKDEKTPLDPQPERTWIEPVVLDPRIASRMRRPELTAEEEARAASIVVSEAEVEGWIKGAFRTIFHDVSRWASGEDRETRPNVGDPDRDSVTGEETTSQPDRGFVPGVVAGMRMPGLPKFS